MTTSPVCRGRTVRLLPQHRALSTRPYPVCALDLAAMAFLVVLLGWEIQNCSRSRSRVHLPLWSAHCGVGLAPSPPFCLSRPPMTHLHEKLLHEKRRHLVRAARSDGHFDGLHRPRNKTSITGWASQPMGGPWWRNPSKSHSSSAACRTWRNTNQARHDCQAF